VQDEVNQEETEEDEVGGMKEETDSIGKVMIMRMIDTDARARATTNE